MDTKPEQRKHPVLSDEAYQLKIRENRLRTMADRQGLHITKSRRRDPLALDYGLYRLLGDDNRRIASGSIDDIEHALVTGKGRR